MGTKTRAATRLEIEQATPAGRYLDRRGGDCVRRYDIRIAAVLGLRAAILIDQLVFRCKMTEADVAEGKRADARYRNSVGEWQIEVGGFSRSEVKRILGALEGSGVLKKEAEYEKNHYGKSIWFYPNYERLEEIAAEGERILADLAKTLKEATVPTSLRGKSNASKKGVGVKKNLKKGQREGGPRRTSASSRLGRNQVQEEPGSGSRRTSAGSTKNHIINNPSIPSSSIPSPSNQTTTPNRLAPGVCSPDEELWEEDAEPRNYHAPPVVPRPPLPRSGGKDTCPSPATSRKGAAVRAEKAPEAASATEGKCHPGSIPFEKLEVMSKAQLKGLLSNLARRINRGKHDSIKRFWQVLVYFVFGNVDAYTPVTRYDIKQTPDLITYCKEAGVSASAFLVWCVEEWEKLNDHLRWENGLTRFPKYRSILNLKDALIECYKGMRIEEKERHEEAKEVGGLFKRLREVPDDHKQRERLVAIIESGDFAVVLDDVCIPFSELSRENQDCFLQMYDEGERTPRGEGIRLQE